MSTANLDSADLKAVTKAGLIREDVMNQIWDISKIPLPLTDIIGTETSKNAYKEWTIDALISPLVLPTALTTIVSNSRVDGSDAAARNDSVTGARVGNHHQISDKIVRISFRADNSDVIGRTKETSYQIMRRQQELRRDVEASMTMNRASAADDGSSAAGVAGGLPTWLSTNVSMGASGTVSTFQCYARRLKATYYTRSTHRNVLTVQLVHYQKHTSVTQYNLYTPMAVTPQL